VDAFPRAIRDTFRGQANPVRADDVRGEQFPSTDGEGYDKKEVAAFLKAAGIRLAAMEATDRPEEPPVSTAVLAEWARCADSTRFSTTRRLREGYDTAEVDAFRDELRDTFLGVRQPPLTWHAVDSKRFTVTFLRPGYDVEQVDAFLDKAELRLATMRRTVKGAT
jgi:DivIVA domain-containing protein